MKRYLFFVLPAVVIASCVEPYVPEVGPYDSTLVVDGIFTDGSDTSTVLLSRSYAYVEGESEPVTAASLIVEDDQGNQIPLRETAPGKYQNDPAVATGQPGRRYRLRIEMADGKQFESDWELLKAAPPVEKLYFEYQERGSDDPLSGRRSGLQILLDTRDPENNTRYYRWSFEETYQFGLTFPPLLRPQFGNPPGRGNDVIIRIGPDEYEGFRCWKTVRSRKIFTASTADLTEDVVAAYPLHFVDNLSPRLYVRYSLLVRQYAISKTFYEYLKVLEATNQTTGSLFDPIPNEVFGNLRSTTGDIPVLGYFSVAGSTATRYFINREEIPDGLNIPFGPICRSDTIELNFRTLYDEVRFRGQVLHNYEYNLNGVPIAFVLSPPECALCSANGATNVRPDFW